jgi:hypothetical protein
MSGMCCAILGRKLPSLRETWKKVSEWILAVQIVNCTIVLSPACFAASISVSVTVLRQSTQVPKMSKKSALSWFVLAMVDVILQQLIVK